MWYGTAEFCISIGGSRVSILVGAEIEGPDARMPSNFPLIRSISITLKLCWSDQDMTQNPWIPGTKKLVDWLLAHPNRLSKVTLHDVMFPPASLSLAINSYSKDKGEQFRRVLWYQMGYLSRLRRVKLEFEDIKGFSPALKNYRLLLASVLVEDERLKIAKKIKRTRARYLDVLAKRVAENG
jgi:hypothetical protein